jgi:hypothetical protein
VSAAVQQFQIQDFDRRSSVVAQLRVRKGCPPVEGGPCPARPLTQLSATIKDNAEMPEYELTLRLAPTNPVQGEFVHAVSPQEMGAALRPLNIWGVWGGNPQIQVLTKQLTPNLELLAAVSPTLPIAISRIND